MATTGADGSGCGGEGNPCRTVQYAVNAVSPGDTVKVATGVYTDLHTYNWFVNPAYPYLITQVIFLDKSITIRGGYTTADWDNADPDANPTILDAQDQGRVIYISANHNVTLEGLQIVNGRGTQEETGAPGGGGGIGVEEYNTGQLTIRNCDILSNTAFLGDYSAYSSGGGAYVHYGALVLENSRIVSNTTLTQGGGIYVREATVTMTNNLFQDNTSDEGGGGAAWGGGAALYECTAYVVHNTFQDNTVGNADGGAAWGGGLYVGWGDLILTHNDFLNNTVDGSGTLGGGLYAGVYAGHTHTITYNLFQGNTASLNGDGRGGGAFLSGGRFVFSHNRVLNNVAAGCGTAWRQGKGGGIIVYADTPALVSDNLFQGNWGATNHDCTGTGGGIYVASQAQLQLEGNHILDNRASMYPDWGRYFKVYGGGVYISHLTTVTVTNNVIAGNRYFEEDDNPFAPEYFSNGGAIYIGGQSTPTNTQLLLLHNTIADNQSPAILNESAGITMSHNIFSGHATDLRTILDTSGAESSRLPTIVADYTLWWPAMITEIMSGTFVHTHDFTGAPDFVSPPLDDYHLGTDSKAIDKGEGIGVNTDIDGHPRPIGTGYDLGADEYTSVDLSPSRKSASPQKAGAGDVVTFTILLRNSGTLPAPNALLSDAIPTHTTYISSSVHATSGIVADTGGIGWTGTVPASDAVTITFQVTVNEAVLIENVAVVNDGYGTSLNLMAWVNAKRIYLPLVLR